MKDLAHKTRRGLEGRVRQGKSGGGLCFGYDLVRKLDVSGETLHGERRIKEGKAAIVRRIFEEFAKGRSPRAIAQSLNKEGVPGPAGRSWGASTIYGNWRRGTGILNNELYIGRLVWNRQQFIKDPATGRRQARLNPGAKWIIEDVPHLRIVDDHLWEAVKERQRDLGFASSPRTRVSVRSVPAMALITEVCWRMKSWRVRWSIRQLCCSGVLVSTKRMLALVTASQIASASVASFFCRLTYGFT